VGEGRDGALDLGQTAVDVTDRVLEIADERLYAPAIVIHDAS
jgi:hypothetical protein